ncbi:hypothetical protein [Endozoicomonas sp. 4G]|uniref:hypothetical protein n=1 Tax=Endozoicomonas sp. 4G TaxID=2872754 RepID=UPI0020785A48|nr:hypothetical protein [Endozoicomonas sp. 4G]
MRKLAELAMKSPKHSLFLAVVFACIPMLFWLSAAVVSLVILRRGIDHGLKLLMWALLPGIAWAAFGQYSVLIGLVTTSLLACVLRQTVSWPKTLLAVVPLGGLVAFAMYQMSPHIISALTDSVMKFLKENLKSSSSGETLQLGEHLRPILEYGVAGALAWLHTLFCVLALILARSWQADLYNPGGFGDEFRKVRLPAAVGVSLLAITLMGSALSPMLTALVPVASLPLFIAGLALVHGLVKLRQRGSFWLIGFYMLLITLTQLAYPVIVLTACLDSLFDFRNRVNQQIQG